MNTSRPLKKTMTRVRAVTVAAAFLCSTAIARADAVTDWNAIAVATAAGQNPFNQARLLAIPAYDVQCIWVITGKTNQIVPAYVPAAYREAIVPLNVYDEHEFLSSLRRYPYAQGVVP